MEPWLWPSIDGEFCNIELISATDTQALYNVPIQVGTDMWYLRYGRDYEMFLDDVTEKISPSKYTVYGLWEGYDSDTEMLCRNVKSLSRMAGQEYRLLYPISGDTGKKRTIPWANSKLCTVLWKWKQSSFLLERIIWNMKCRICLCDPS